MIDFIAYLRTIATLLVMNSHCKSIYPISDLATGGAIGNAIFFGVSGYCLAKIRLPFWKWYKKRVFRIYPAVIVVGILSLLTTTKVDSVLGVIYIFIFPIRYWFIAAIILLYIPFYFIVKKTRRIMISVGIIIVIYGLVYLQLDTRVWTIENYWWFKSIYYFIVMLLGAYFRIKAENSMIDKSILKNSIVSFTLLTGFYGFKVLCYHSAHMMQFQFMQHIILTVFVCYFTKLVMDLAERLKDKKWIALDWFKKIGDYSLEIFLVQIWVLDMIEMYDVLFPVNIVIYICSTFMIAWIIQQMQNLKLRRR